jgi:hypothetical protein
MSQIHGSQQRPAIVQFIARYPADGLSARGDIHADKLTPLRGWQ